MEKKTPHYKLADVQAAVKAQGINAFTFAAQDGFAIMRLSEGQALAVIDGLTSRQLYKSMTTHADHTIWQDVYHANTPNGLAYIKVTLRQNGRIVIQFKEK